MEKRRAHYDLVRVKALIHQGAYRVTRVALSCARRDFALTEPKQLAEVVLSLSSARLYKSMTTAADSRVWQDVYHGDVDGIDAYIKIQILDENTVIISFKALEHD